MSQFAFLKDEFPGVYEAATKAEAAAVPDPRTGCFYARRAVELLVHWVYKHDKALELPFQDNISSLIHEPTFQKAAGNAVFQKAKFVVRYGNQAVHSPKAVSPMEAIGVVRELFHIGYWLAHTYAKGAKPAASVQFDQKLLPHTSPLPKQAIDALQKAEVALREKDEKLSEVLKDKESLDAELKRLREEIAAAKAANEKVPDTHDYSEEETRDLFIDLLLKEAGWPLDQPRDREFEVDGMPNKRGKGYVDYVLWGDDGLPLAVVEAKRTKRNPKEGKQQAKLYADSLEKRYGRRPVIFYTNGYEHWLWDDTTYPERTVQGFYKKDELELLVQRRAGRQPLRAAEVNDRIVERYYQTRAIRKVCEALETDHLRRALLVMATGAGKTRTVIALADVLMRCGWAKRVLFLADRVALVNQGCNAFKSHLPDAGAVNLVTEKGAESRVYVSTYPTMMGQIDDAKDGVRRFGVGHFDLIVIDEAHRSVFQKYRAIFDYFDSFLVGLTATPKGDVDRNTYDLFHLQTGVPTDAYPLEEAVKDGYLVPAKSVSVPLKFPRQGIAYKDLTAEEQEEWDAKEWDADGVIPTDVDPAAVNAWLFNADTVDKALKHLMEHGIKVAGGDRLGKTIIFAKNQKHAEFIEERFNHHYPKLKGQFARVITYSTEYAQSVIDDFSTKEKAPHIAVSVDMLDTGIDVPEVVNLVFFKVVRSKTKFWQMVGRGTRLCPHLFGPGQHKTEFRIFDFCGNLEFFSVDPETADGAAAESLGKRLFKARLELVGALDQRDGDGELRAETAERLRTEVAAMNLENFVIRPQRKLVEAFAKPEAWAAESLTPEAKHELAAKVAGLPTELPAEGEEAKRFDLLLLRLQLAVLLVEPSFERLRDQVKEIAGLLEEKKAIPMVNAQMPLILDLQSDEWWQDATVPMLEQVRKKLRELVRFIEKAHRTTIYTTFDDQIGEAAEVPLPAFAGGGGGFEQFKLKAKAFLRQHADAGAVRKLRRNEPLTPNDLTELEDLLARCGGSAEAIEQAKEGAAGVGVFVRGLVGLDREAAKRAFGEFLAGSTLSANQIEFVNLVIDHLTERGVLDAAVLYESPFTDRTPKGPDGLFARPQVDALLGVLRGVRSKAQAV